MDLQYTHLAAAGALAKLLAAQDCVGSIAAQTGVALPPTARGTAACILTVGAATAGTTPTFDFHLETSDDNSTGWVAIPNTTIAQIAGVNTGGVALLLSFRPGEQKKYVRAVPAVGGTSSPSYPASAVLLYLP